MRLLLTLTALVSIAGVLLQMGCSKDSDTSVDPVPPDTLYVESFSPASGATDVSVGAEIMIDFSHYVDETSVDSTTFSILPPVQGECDAHQDTVWFRPDSLLQYGVTYQITVQGLRADANKVQHDTLAFSFTTAAQPVSWQMRLGGDFAEVAEMTKAPNGDIVVAVNSRETAGGSVTPLLVRISNSGEIVWERSDYAWDDNEISDIDVSPHDNIFVLTDGNVVEVARLDADGDQFWAKTYSDTTYWRARDKIRARSDGGFYVATAVYLHPDWGYDTEPFLMSMNSEGTVLNRMSMAGNDGLTGETDAFDVFEDDSWVWAVSFLRPCSSPGSSDYYDAVVLLGDKSLTSTWGRKTNLEDEHASSCDNNFFNDVITTRQGSALLCGAILNSSRWLVMLSGSQVIFNKFNETPGCWKVEEALDQGFLLFRGSEINKISTSGTTIWTESLTPTCRDLEVADDNGIIVAANSPSTEGGVLVTKLNQFGQFTGAKAAGELLPVGRTRASEHPKR